MLDVLTARPSADELSACRTMLYGHVRPATAYSTGAWLRDVGRLIDSGAFAAKPPIFVGGTGLYFRALAEGISEMPDIPTDDPRPLALATRTRRGRRGCTAC